MPLKKSEIAQFKKRLLEMKEQISRIIEGTKKEVASADQSKGYSQHSADEGTDDFVKNVSLEVTSKELDVLRQIDLSLDKIEDGTYGVCEITGEDIPIKRLEAIPYATMTVQAQENLEKGSK